MNTGVQTLVVKIQKQAVQAEKINVLFSRPSLHLKIQRGRNLEAYHLNGVDSRFPNQIPLAAFRENAFLQDMHNFKVPGMRNARD